MSKVVLYMSMSLDGFVQGGRLRPAASTTATEWITDSASTASGCTTGYAPAAWIPVRTGLSADPAQPCSAS
jgi:hypothetical protein